MKFAYPTRLSPTMPVAPYAGIGLQYMGFVNNGSGVGTDYANDSDYDYASGWGEWILALPVISLGIDFEFGDNFVISPEYRFMVAGSASTDWAPVGYAPEFDDVTYAAFSVSFGKKF